MATSFRITASEKAKKRRSAHRNAEIRTGTPQSVQRIRNGNWAAEFGVSPALIREAGNMAQTKRSSHSFHLSSRRVDTPLKERRSEASVPEGITYTTTFPYSHRLALWLIAGCAQQLRR